MSYEIFQFNLGNGYPQAYVLKGAGEHEGTNETVQVRDLWNLPTGMGLASYLDRRFLLAHQDRRMKEIAADIIAAFARAFADAAD